MQIKTQIKTVPTNANNGGVVIATNLIKVKEMLDKDGNVIDPRTKIIIKPVTQ